MDFIDLSLGIISLSIVGALMVNSYLDSSTVYEQLLAEQRENMILRSKMKSKETNVHKQLEAVQEE